MVARRGVVAREGASEVVTARTKEQSKAAGWHHSEARPDEANFTLRKQAQAKTSSKLIVAERGCKIGCERGSSDGVTGIPYQRYQSDASSSAIWAGDHPSKRYLKCQNRQRNVETGE